MNENRYQSGSQIRNKTDDIDLVSFDRRKRSNEIRMNEEYERERRRRELIRRRKQERIRRAKIARMKALCMLGVIAIGILFAIIGIIVGVVKAFSGPDEPIDTVAQNAVSAEETAFVENFLQYDGYLYSEKENDFLSTAEKMISGITLSDNFTAFPAVSNKINEYGELTERYMFLDDSESYIKLRDAVKSTPIFSNGYVWTEAESMKSTVTGGYMYDTNTSFITAVANICLYEGSTAFLYETDTDARPNKDVSRGMTVKEKLELAISYLFDGNTTEGGVKFDTISSLCYIHTAENSGTSSGIPSNKWFNFRFGYLDAYTNISFNKAMTALSKLYALMGDTDKANEYASCAKQHAEAFNSRFWYENSERYIGCYDKNNIIYDYGFTFLNLEAISTGIADKEKTEKILSWLDGERIVSTDYDASKGEDIYYYGFAPRNTTVPARDDWWDYLGGKLPLSTSGGYDKYYQNGGVSLSTAYYDVMARYVSGDKQGAIDRLLALADEYKETGFLIGYDNAIYDVKGNALSGLTPTAIIKTFFGVSTDGFTLSIIPDTELIPQATAEEKDSTFNNPYGLSNICFAGNKYGVLYDSSDIYITAEKNTPVRLKIGVAENASSYELVFVENGLEVSKISVPVENDGTVVISAEFGSGSYLKLLPEKNK